MISDIRSVAVIAVTSLLVPVAISQEPAEPEFVSVGRGAPVLGDIPNIPFEQPHLSDPSTLPIVGPFRVPGPPSSDGSPTYILDTVAAANGEAPEGIEPLARDIFTSDDFYADRELWNDPRYFRCNSSAGLEQQLGGAAGLGEATGGDDLPRTAAWGPCDRDYPREGIVSPYDFRTAQAHYDALLQESRRRGGPTRYTYATVPGEWTGRYRSPVFEMFLGTWYGMVYNQIPTILSLLTDEYRTRFMQQAYHEANTAASQWPAQYCWPEGFMRRWHGGAVNEHQIVVTPSLVQILTGVADNFITNIHIGREFNMDGPVPRLGAEVPRWYGETIGFWHEDALITWTSNIQGWMAHGAFEFSNEMQAIEIYTPNRAENGDFVGLEHEAIFYDPRALMEPVRIVRNLTKMSDFDEGDPHVFVECVQTIFPIQGRAAPVAPGTVIEYQVPDMYGRPWAEIWERYFEQDMQRPDQDDIFNFE